LTRIAVYSWGDDDDQSSTTGMNFLNSAYDGKRGPVGDSAYKEYIPSADLTNVRKVASATIAAMKAVGGRSYVSMQAVGLYPTSGASDDYAFSRYWAKSGVNKVRDILYSDECPIVGMRFWLIWL
jgi:hypothetical protein